MARLSLLPGPRWAWAALLATSLLVAAPAAHAQEEPVRRGWGQPLGPASEDAAEEPAPPVPDAETRAPEDPRVARVREALAPARRLVERVRSGEVGRDAVLLLLASVLGVVVGTLSLFFLLPLLRGRGDLTVHLNYPEELDGSFRVRVTRRRGRRRATSAKADPGEDRAATRYDHPMVARETRFQRIQARTWWVRVEGLLQDPESDDIVESRFADERIKVKRGKTVRLSFDLRPEHCPVDVKILWDKRPVREASVALHGVPYSLRFARGGTVRLKLARGSHTLVVGSGDRVAEHTIEVGSYRTTWAVVDMAGSDALLFKGCPNAVEPYLQGDYAGAARALERDGQAQVAHLLLARIDAEQGRQREAAEHYEKAERLVEAAELRASLREFSESAALFDRAGKPARAAEMHRASGDVSSAGAAWERAEDWAQAAACYRESGEKEKLAGALENLGSYFEAAELCMERSDWTRAIRDLQHVAPGDGRYADACRMQADAYEQIGDGELAARKLDECVRSAGPEGAPLDIQARLADVLERNGDVDQALHLYESIRETDPAWPNVTTRIEKLRKQLSHERTATVTHQPTARGFDTPGFSRYEILEEIGRGGMGVVYKAKDRRLGRVVALKKLPESLRDHPKAVELFLREARAAAALNHTNIVTVFDADEEDGQFFITMELLEGQNLYNVLRRVERVKPRDVARLGVQTSAGLAYAHENRIVHRDIKTANLFFTRDKVLKIMDFGLAKMVEEVRRRATVVAGTPYYMAPEQSAGETVDGRADLYALGVTLFELATGTVPFEEGDVAFHHRNTPAPDPRERNAEVPDALARLILDLLAKAPDDRPASAREVAHRLQNFLDER